MLRSIPWQHYLPRFSGYNLSPGNLPWHPLRDFAKIRRPLSPAKLSIGYLGALLGGVRPQAWWAGFSRSFTVLTGLNVLTGTSTKTVFQ